MELIRKNKYVHTIVRLFISLVLAVAAFYLFGLGLILKGNVVIVSEPFSVLIGVITGYYAALLPKILKPIYQEE